MKLYEFLLEDYSNDTEEELIDKCQYTLDKEADLQGWEPGYTVVVDSLTIIRGSKIYQMSVHGNYSRN